MKKKLSLGICSLAFLLAGQELVGQTTTPTSDASGQDNKKEATLELSPFIVQGDDSQGYRAQRTMVGSRSAKELTDLPVSVALINLQQINDFGALSVIDVLKFGVSGVTQNQSFNDDVNIRGFRAGAPLRNGFERQTGTGAGGPNKSQPLYDIERIEILKGPAAMLNGSNGGIGGSINHVTRAATPTRQGEAQVSITGRGGVRLQANMSGPMINSEDLKANYRFTLGYLNADEPHGKTLEWQDQKFFGAGLAFYFGQASSLLIDGYYFQNDDYLYLEDFLDITAPTSSTTGLRDAKFNRHSTQSYSPGRKQDAYWPYVTTVINAVFLSKLTDNSDLRIAYSYSENDDDRLNNRSIGVNADNYTVTRQAIRNHSGETNNAFQIDFLNSRQTSWAKFDTTLGADGFISRYWAYQAITFMPALDTRTGTYPDDEAWFKQFPNDTAWFFDPRPISLGNPPTRDKVNVTSASVYVQENVTLLKDKLILVGGIRKFMPGGTNENLVTNVVTNRPDQGFNVHKYGIVYKVLPKISVYVTKAQNYFVAPRGNVDKFIQADRLGPPFKDSLGKLAEVGVKYEHNFSDKISIYGSAAAFEMEQTNVVTFGVLPDGPPGSQGVIQSAKDSSSGWETDLGIQFKTGSGRADILLTYFHGNSAIAADEGLAYVRQAQNFVPQKFSFLGKYSWSSGSLRGLRAGLGVIIQDDKRQGAWVVETPPLASAFFGYAVNKRWDVQLNLDNLTNERYIVQVATPGLVQGSDTFASKLTVKYLW
jgi:outer membrane receptor protein involved in Fe transport